MALESPFAPPWGAPVSSPHSVETEYPTASSRPHIRFMVTPNCNLDCLECQPGGENITMPEYNNPLNPDLIRPDEIQALSKIAADIGYGPIKLTGGEATTRNDLPEIVAKIKQVTNEEVNVGTNGLALGGMAQALKDAGVDVIHVGLNTLNRETFLADTKFDALHMVLNSIEKVRSLDLEVNINVVLMKQNIGEFDDFIDYAKKLGLKLRVLPLSNLGSLPYWSEHFVAPKDLENHIMQRYGVAKDMKQPWSGIGTPMSVFVVDGVEIRIINPQNGTYYADFCETNSCGNYPCIDGVWALRIGPYGDSKYCFYPNSGRESFNYLDAVRREDYATVQKQMQLDFDVLNGSTLQKIWHPEIENGKYQSH